jgi:predicted patatin/cPLA2 family phospholipase
MKDKKKKEKLAIISKGGGCISSYSAGALYCLIKNYKIKPDILIGNSGGVANLICVVSKKIESLKKIWFEIVINRMFISLKRFYKIVDINYLVDEVFRQKLIDENKIKNSNIKLFIQITNFKTGESEFFSNKHINDLKLILKATGTIPIIGRKPILIGKNSYVDGAFSFNIYENIQKAIKEGATKIIVIDDNQKISKLAILLFKFYSYFVNKNLRKIIEKYCEKSTKNFNKKNKNVFYIKHSGRLSIWALDNNKKDLRKTFEIGYKDVLNNKKLKEFLGLEGK